jgi:PPOX class probable F420-dependent enzyme
MIMSSVLNCLSCRRRKLRLCCDGQESRRRGDERTVARGGGVMAREMTADETRAFLLEGTRTGKLATTRADGRPHVTPIWFVLDEADLILTTGAGSVKATDLRRDGRVCVCVDDQAPPFSYVMVEGTAALSDDLDELRRWATAIGGRYMGAELADDFGARNAVPGELLVRITPTRVIAQADLAD